MVIIKEPLPSTSIRQKGVLNGFVEMLMSYIAAMFVIPFSLTAAVLSNAFNFKCQFLSRGGG